MMLTCEYDDERQAFDDFYRRRRAGGLITPYISYRAVPTANWYSLPNAIVSLDDLKEHLRIDDTSEDGYLTGLLMAAGSYVQDISNTIILQSDVIVRWVGFPPGDEPFFLPFGGETSDWLLSYTPAIIAYQNENGLSSTLADMTLVTAGISFVPNGGGDWPTDQASDRNGSVYFQGTVAPQKSAPQLATAIKMIAGYWYNAREAVVECKPETLPLAFEALVANNTGFNFGGRWK